MRLHNNVQENETNQYVVVMSIYLYICKYFKFSMCHPVIYVVDVCKDMEACLHTDGLIKCNIVPLEKLQHPASSFRCNKKLKFCLCRSCVITSSTGECGHIADEELASTGTWVMDEVKLTLEKG